jgi:hypothetical protein
VRERWQYGDLRYVPQADYCVANFFLVGILIS